jgi:hypothetical protein
MKKCNNMFRLLMIATLLEVLAGTGALVTAQPGGHMQRFKEEKIKFYNEKLELSESEAEKFWPVTQDLHNRMMKINEDEKSLLVYYSSNYMAMSDEEIDETTRKFLDLQQKRLELTTAYHQTFVQIIGKKKTMHMYALDREFRMHVLKKFRAGEGGGRGYRNR